MEVRLGWLGGIYDGEGSFSVTSNPASKKQRNPFGQLQPKVTIWNTDQDIINEIMSILDDQRLTYFVYTRKPPINGLSRKVGFSVEVHGMKRIVKMLPIMIPYLVGKKAKAIALYNFVSSRLSRPPQSPYSNEEIAFANSARDIPLHACPET
uniref:Homing endonuclease n=1 Tax=viral metagenome TaxID=1070528 RepID=A0A6H1ZKU3_9ZZZZ